MKPVSSPPRLMEGQGPLAELMREAQDDYEASLEPAAAWQRYRKLKSRLAWPQLLAPALAVAAVALWLFSGHLAKRTPDLVARAEPESPKVVAPLPRASVDVAPRPLPKERQPAHAPRLPRPPSSAERAHAEALAASAPTAPLAASTEAPVDCLALARSGDVRAAERCFETQAGSRALSAEVALYELARLRRDVLGKPAEALGTLDDYVQRFPTGTLIGEVRFSRLELLLKLGRSQEALAASDQLLASPSGIERAAEIHFLRGNVYRQALGDATRAAAEYAQARVAPGRLGDEAAFQEASSLERAGSPSLARKAFEAYLARSSAKHRPEAELRLKALEAAP